MKDLQSHFSLILQNCPQLMKIEKAHESIIDQHFKDVLEKGISHEVEIVINYGENIVSQKQTDFSTEKRSNVVLSMINMNGLYPNLQLEIAIEMCCLFMKSVINDLENNPFNFAQTQH